MTLHTLCAGPDSPAFRDCLKSIASGDALLLTGDGVYAAIEKTPAGELICASDAGLYVLEDDAIARGISLNLVSQATFINYDGFVALSERYTRQVAWY